MHVRVIGSVLWLVGAPMAGTANAVAAATVAALLAVPMALAFSHHAKSESGR